MSSSFQQLASCMALRAFSHSPPPYSCSRKQKHSVLIYPCALRYIHSIQAHCIPGTTFVPHFAPFHFILLSFHAHTSASHSFGSFLPFLLRLHSCSQSLPKLFSHAFPAVCFYFLWRVSPNRSTFSIKSHRLGVVYSFSLLKIQSKSILL